MASESEKTRRYRKRRRAEHEAETRRRITEAAVRLHGTIGPAKTTVSGIAREAGVQRATVYRHFPDDESLFLACSGQWLSRQRLPDPDTWDIHDDPFAVLRSGLTEIYRYYRDGEPMLTAVLRDAEVVPRRIRDGRAARELEWRRRLTRRIPGGRRKTVEAAVAHATSFSTWRSLCVDLGLSNASAVDLMVGMAHAAARGARP
jgi:AcrR family transcriptional regulator